ncbi:hypothetical protein BH18VER1_BH18VER1_15120 [soil metagenome]
MNQTPPAPNFVYRHAAFFDSRTHAHVQRSGLCGGYHVPYADAAGELNCLALMKVFVCSLLALAATAQAQGCDPHITAQDILEREGQFQRVAEQQGTRAAVLEFFGDEGVAFEPGPVNARKLWQARAEGGPTSKWQPLFMSMARSCDLAFTAGRMEWKQNNGDEKHSGYGEYVHVWRKQKDGTWKVAAEVRAQVPGPRAPGEVPQVVSTPAHHPLRTRPARQSNSDELKSGLPKPRRQIRLRL